MEKPQDKSILDPGEIDLLDYFVVLAKYSRMILATCVAVMVITYFYLFCSRNIYKAETKLLPPQQNLTLSSQLLDIMGGGTLPGQGSNAGGLGAIGSLLGISTPNDFYVSLITSDTVCNHIIKRFNLLKVYKQENEEDTRIILRRRAKAFAEKRSGLISIQVTDSDPILNAAMANAFAEELGNLLKELTVQEARGRLAFLDSELAKANLNLTKAEEALRSFSEKHSVIKLDAQTKGALEYIAQLKANIDSKEVQAQVLRQQATPANFEVIRLETEIKGLKAKLKDMECRFEPLTDSNICPPTSRMPVLNLEYFRLYREVKFQDGLYLLFAKMVEIARLDMAKDVAMVQVVDKAYPPVNRANQRLAPTLLVGIAILFIMIVLSFILEYIHKIGREESKAQRITQLSNYLKPWMDAFNKSFKYLKKV